MLQTFVVFTTILACGLPAWSAHNSEKGQTGTTIGVLKARQDSKNKKSVTLEILAAGEEKARTYLVAYNPNDPKAKGPFDELLALVNTAKLGDRVEITWVNTPKGSEGGYFVSAFRVLKKTGE